MKTLTIARKTLIEAWRDRQLTLVYLLFPAMMVSMYYLAYGGQTSSMANFLTVLVNNRDQGPLGGEFVRMLHSAEFDGQPVFTIQEDVEPQVAETTLEEGKAALLITIPADFSAVLRREKPGPLKMELLGDPLTDTYVFARGFLTGIGGDFVDKVTGWQKPLPTTLEFLPNTGKVSDFQFGIPGLMIFGVLFGAVTSALMLVRESSSGTLQRIRLSGARGFQILGGIALANLVMASLQVLLCFEVALAFGFRSPGSLLAGMGIVLVLCLGAVGVGFLAACFSHSEGEAAGISTAFMVPLVFLSGAIFPLPAVYLFSIGGQKVQVYDIMPSTHATEALRRVLLYGDSITAILYPLIMMAILSLLLLGVGIWFYQKRILKG